MAQHEPKLTTTEKAKLACLGARMCKRSLAGEDVYLGDLKRKFNRVLDGAAKRAEKDA
ncbi:DUF6257 family protein [Streptomyces sp. NPDC101227]|uniref:DUF6257 family protein n=1 Tax=Streptomyces sp. NPDC101227 TaxID=3366136 RepID=UPI00381C91BC